MDACGARDEERPPRHIGNAMILWLQLKAALRNLFRKPQVETQLDNEVRAYIDMLTDENLAAGMSPSEARRNALADSGGIEPIKQAVRDNRAGNRVELLWQDVRY